MVPEVIGLGAVEACGAIRSAGLTPCGPDDGPEPISGTIAKQEPAPRAQARIGDSVVLWSEFGRETGSPIGDDPKVDTAPLSG